MSKANEHFDLMDILDFTAEKEYHEGSDEYQQKLAELNFDEVFEGYRLFFYRIEREDKTPSVYYKCCSNHWGLSTRSKHETLEEMCEMYNYWVNGRRNGRLHHFPSI